MKPSKKISPQKFDALFDSNEDVTAYLDTENVQVHKQTHRINIDFPSSFLKKLDREARKIGVARTALIKLWLSERLEKSSQ